MPRKLIAALVLAALAPLSHAEPVWKKSGEVSYLCGGVGAEEFARLESLKPTANLAVLLTQGSSGAYLSDVMLTLSGGAMQAPLMVGSAGPLCVFRMPSGTYHVQAEHQGSVKTTQLDIGGKLRSTQIRFGE